MTLALQMRQQGKPWSEIYPACIKGYPNLDPAIRGWRQRELRDRVRSRRYQQRKRRKLLGHRLDRLFWIALRRLWSGWAESLIIVKPETVVSWHRTGFRLFWRWRSRLPRPGRPKVSEELRQLIRRMKAENPTWGAPRIHGELLRLGFDISEPTVSRYLQRLKRRGDEGKAKRWLAFLNNHREVIAAFDLFTVPTLTFRVLYGFFVIEHGRRCILHFNATAHPTSDWIVQQLAGGSVASLSLPIHPVRP